MRAQPRSRNAWWRSSRRSSRTRRRRSRGTRRVQPGPGPLHHPPPGQHGAPLLLLWLGDDLDRPPADRPRPVDQVGLVSVVDLDQPQPQEAPQRPSEDQLGTLALLAMRRVRDHDQPQAQRIDEDVALAAVDPLGRLVATRPPVSVVWTDWRSRIAALGVAFQVPSLLHARKSWWTVFQGG